MKSETITQRADLVIRRHILEPGEALPWHTDRCHRFTVVVTGEALSIEYRDSGESNLSPCIPAWQIGISLSQEFTEESIAELFRTRK